MTKEQKEKSLKIIKIIQADLYDDIKALDGKPFNGKPFNGKSVATQFGNVAAQINALATILSQVINGLSDNFNIKL